MYPTKYLDRTTNHVERSLGIHTPDIKLTSADHYVKCRFDPFSPLPTQVKIPDGRGKNVITRDFKTAYNISCLDTDQLEFRISPTFPYPVRFHQRNAANSLINGLILGVANTTTPPDTLTALSIGTPVQTAMAALFPSSIGFTSVEATNIVGARIVTCGYRLFYTGAAAAASGMVVVDNLNAKITTVSSSSTAYTEFVYSAAGATPNVALLASSYPTIVVDQTSFEYSTMTSDQVVLRPENGLHGVLKMTKLASDHPFAPWYDSGASVLTSLSGSTGVYSSIYSLTDGLTTANTDKKGAFFWDDAFQEVNIKLSSPGAFRLELTMCIEMDLAMQSAMIDLARPSPMYNSGALTRDMMLNSLVVPAPFSMPPLDLSMQQLNIGGRQSVRKAKPPQRKTQCKPTKTGPKQTGKAARRRRNRQRKRAKANAR